MEKKDKIIKTLEDKLLKVFKKEFGYHNEGPIWLVPENVTYTDIFERFKRTTKAVNGDNYIAALCLRLTQAGQPCYPSNGVVEFTGIKSTLKDDEVEEILFIEHMIDKDVTKSIEYICNLNSNTTDNDQLVLA